MLHIIAWSSVMCVTQCCAHTYTHNKKLSFTCTFYTFVLHSRLNSTKFLPFTDSFLLHLSEEFFSLFFITHTPPNFGLYGHKHPQAAHRKSCRENMHQDGAGGQPQGIITRLLREQGIHIYLLSQTAEKTWPVADHCSSWLCIQRKKPTLPQDVGNTQV